NFNAGIGANGAVRALVIQPDGKILVGGDFTNFNGQALGHIARLNPNGSVDSTFVPGGMNDTNIPVTIDAIALNSSGQIFIGGNFTNIATATRVVPYLAQLNSTGAYQTTFDTTQAGGGGGLNGLVTAIAVQPDNKVVAVGAFTNYMGVQAG